MLSFSSEVRDILISSNSPILGGFLNLTSLIRTGGSLYLGIRIYMGFPMLAEMGSFGELFSPSLIRMQGQSAFPISPPISLKLSDPKLTTLNPFLKNASS